jgi:hypothetical protein
MTVPTQPVTVRLADFGGPSIAGVRVTARMSEVDRTATGIFVSTEPVTAVTDADGVAVLQCFPNAVAPAGLGTRGTTTEFTASMPRSRPLRVQAAVPNVPCNLTDIQIDEAVGLNAAQLALQQAQAAASAAEISADAAEQAQATTLGIVPYVGPAAPPGAVDAREWFNTTNGRRYIRYNDGTSVQWVEAGSVAYIDDPQTVVSAQAAAAAAEDAAAEAAAFAEAAGNSALYVGPTPPVSAPDAREWFNTTNGRRYFRYSDSNSTQWLEAGSIAYVDEPSASKQLNASEQTPNVASVRVAVFANPAPTLVVGLAGSPWQRLIVQASNGLTTLVNGPNLRTNTGANKVLTANSCLELVADGTGTAWKEVGTL